MGKIKIHPLFVIYVFVCLYFGWLNSIFFYVVSVVLHEYGHLLVARLLGYEVDGILFNVYGAGLKTNNIYKPKDDILISIAGPLINIILIVLIVCLWWLFPTSYVFTLDFLKSNLVVFVFNILPIYPLDGGRIIMAILEGKVNRKKLVKINTIICLVLGLLFLLMFIVSFFFVVNLNMLFVGLFLTINCISVDNNSCYEKTRVFSKDVSKPCEIKIFKVNSLDKKSLLKCVSPRYYSLFLRNEKSGKKIYSEDDLFN